MKLLNYSDAKKKFSHVVIGKDALVHESARIGPGVEIGAHTVIWGGTWIGDSVTIGDRATIDTNAVLHHDVQIGNDTRIGERAKISHQTVIGRNTVIDDDAMIGEGAEICAGAEIPRGRRGVTACVVINGLGETKKLTALICDDGLIINIGCMNKHHGLSVEETEKEIAKKYPDKSHPYYAALTFIKGWYANRQEACAPDSELEPERES